MSVVSSVLSRVSTRSSGWKIHPRVASLMDSIFAIGFGLGLRFVVDAVSHHDFKLTGTLVGLWEGIILLHFLKKMPKSTDPYVAYGVRLFVDFLCTESVARLVLVLIWTGLGMVLADITPALWDDVGLNRIWRRFRRDLYTISRMIPTVAFFPPPRTVRFSPSREPTIIPEEPSVLDSQPPSVVTTTQTATTPNTVPATNTSTAPAAREVLRRRVPGYFPTEYSDTDTDLSSIRAGPSTGRTSRRLSVYPQAPDYDDSVTDLSSNNDLDDANLSSGASSASTERAGPSSITFDTAVIPDMEEEEEEEQLLVDTAAVPAKDEEEHTPRQAPIYLPPTPSDSAVRWRPRLEPDEPLPIRPLSSLPQIPDFLDEPTTEDLEKIQPSPAAQETVEEKPPTPPAKDDLPSRFTIPPVPINPPPHPLRSTPSPEEEWEILKSEFIVPEATTSTNDNRQSLPPAYKESEEFDDIYGDEYAPPHATTTPHDSNDKGKGVDIGAHTSLIDDSIVSPLGAPFNFSFGGNAGAHPWNHGLTSAADAALAESARQEEEKDRQTLEAEVEAAAVAEAARQEEEEERLAAEAAAAATAAATLAAEEAAERKRKEDAAAAEQERLKEEEAKMKREEEKAERKKKEEADELARQQRRQEEEAAERKRTEEEAAKKAEEVAAQKAEEKQRRAEEKQRRLEKERLAEEKKKKKEEALAAKKVEEAEAARIAEEAEVKAQEEAAAQRRKDAEEAAARREKARLEKEQKEQKEKQEREAAEAAAQETEEKRKKDGEEKRKQEEEQRKQEEKQKQEEALAKAKADDEAADVAAAAVVAIALEKDLREKEEQKAKEEADRLKETQTEAQHQHEETPAATGAVDPISSPDAQQVPESTPKGKNRDLPPTPISPEPTNGQGADETITPEDPAQAEESGESPAQADDLESVITEASEMPTKVGDRLERLILAKAQMVEVLDRIEDLKQKLEDPEQDHASISIALKTDEKILKKMERKEQRRYAEGLAEHAYNDPLTDREDYISFGNMGPKEAGLKTEEKLEELMKPGVKSLNLTVSMAVGKKSNGSKQKTKFVQIVQDHLLLQYSKEDSSGGRITHIKVSEEVFRQWLLDYRIAVTGEQSDDY